MHLDRQIENGRKQEDKHAKSDFMTYNMLFALVV